MGDRYGLKQWQIDSLVPMSIEQLRLENKHNSRAKGVLQLWFIDASGGDHLFIESEIRTLQLDQRFSWYMRANRGIKYINRERHHV